LPAAVEAKHQTLDNVSSVVAEYSTVTETAENLLRSVDDAAKKEPFGTADEQLRKQQVGSSSELVTSDCHGVLNITLCSSLKTTSPVVSF